MLTRGKALFFIIVGAIGGLVFSVQAFHVFAVRNAPVVTGRVVARTPIEQYSVPRVDFTIQIEGADTQVHAHTQRYLIDKIPETVRFHYNGDSAREVFLFEHENSPYLIVLLFWGLALILALGMRLPYIRRQLGWES
jgi:hypothetical protein